MWPQVSGSGRQAWPILRPIPSLGWWTASPTVPKKGRQGARAKMPRGTGSGSAAGVAVAAEAEASTEDGDESESGSAAGVAVEAEAEAANENVARNGGGVNIA